MPSYSRNNRFADSSNSSRTIVTTSLLYKSSTPAPMEVITLQYEDVPVFVKRPETFQEAIDTAKEFHQLAHLPAQRVGFALNDIAHVNRFVRISESAWAAISAKIPGGTIINVLLLPDLEEEKCPPQYGSLDVPTLPPKDGRYLSIRRVASSTSTQADLKTGHGLLSWMGVGK